MTAHERADAVAYLVRGKTRARRVLIFSCPICGQRHVSQTVLDVDVLKRRPVCGGNVELHIVDVEDVAKRLGAVA